MIDNTVEYAAEIRDFIIKNFLFGDGLSLDNDASFLSSSVLDSTGILELMMFLEETYNIKILHEETIPENLDSINRAAEFVRRKRWQLSSAVNSPA
jgi:acyl carrier protein